MQCLNCGWFEIPEQTVPQQILNEIAAAHQEMVEKITAKEAAKAAKAQEQLAKLEAREERITRMQQNLKQQKAKLVCRPHTR